MRYKAVLRFCLTTARIDGDSSRRPMKTAQAPYSPFIRRRLLLLIFVEQVCHIVEHAAVEAV